MIKKENEELQLTDLKEENIQNDDSCVSSEAISDDVKYNKQETILQNKNSTKRVLLDTPANDLLIQKFFTMVCEICTQSLQSFAHAKEHFQSVHQRSVSLRCCQKPFTKLYRMVQHCRWHEDPNAFRFDHNKTL